MNGGARKAAHDALTAITKDGAYTALALKKHLPSSLSGEDKAFASRLVRTTLENLLRIDYQLNQFITTKRVHGSVRNVLRLGACQILYMGVEEYAAVSESVRLVKKIKPQMSGFVNAVLRALIGGSEKIRYPQGRNAQSLSICASYPVWMCEKFIADFGYDFTEALLSYKPQPGTTVRANTIKANAQVLESELNNLGLTYTKGSITDSYIVNGFSGIENMQIYQSGMIAVQSHSAMRAVLASDIKPGGKLLDCCAAPGGKSAYAAALAGNALEIVAWDIHEHRVDMTNKNYDRLGVANAKAVLQDASAAQPCLNNAFDYVIVDAPCSAMGLMTRNPDIRYNRKAEDISALGEKQHSILSTCWRYVKPGGMLSYYTCSINKEENEEVTDKFIAENSGFEYAAKPQTLYPHIDGSDGFYIAVMRRKR